MPRKDGRPKFIANICPDHETNPDPYPWEHPNTGRIPFRYGFEGQDKWAPRADYCQGQECYRKH